MCSWHFLSISWRLLTPPKGTLDLIKNPWANSGKFWSKQENSGKYHCAPWKSLCYPYIKRGDSFRSIADTSKAFRAKSGGISQLLNSLWSSFMLAVCCHNSHPSKYLMEKWTFLELESYLRHQRRDGVSYRVEDCQRRCLTLVWYVVFMGPIYRLMPLDLTSADINLREVLDRRTWNWDILTSHPTNEIKDKLY